MVIMNGCCNGKWVKVVATAAHDLVRGFTTGPETELSGPLVLEHLEAIDGPAPAGLGLTEQASGQRGIDNVHDHWKAGEQGRVDR
jgi:hypothetical protein